MSSHSAIQPFACVLGASVAGNPMQFVIERVFADLGLDWQFASFSIGPADFAKAIEGAKAMRFAGLAIASPFESLIQPHVDACSVSASEANWIDCISHVEGTWRGENQLGRAVAEAVLSAAGCEQPTAKIIGHGARAVAIREALVERSCCVLESDRTEESDRDEEAPILILADDAEGNPAAMPEDLQIRNVDLFATLAFSATASSAGSMVSPKQTLDGLDFFEQSISNYVKDWTGADASRSLIRESCEEYLEL